MISKNQNNACGPLTSSFRGRIRTTNFRIRQVADAIRFGIGHLHTDLFRPASPTYKPVIED